MVTGSTRREIGGQMATYRDEFRPRGGASGFRSALRVPGRFGTGRSATTADGPPEAGQAEQAAQATQADQAFFERQPSGTVAVRHDGIRLAVPGALGDL